MECQDYLSCWSMILTAQALQPLERPLHTVEAIGTVRLWLQIQLPLRKQCCFQASLQLLGALCPLRSAGWASYCIRRSSEFKQFRHQLYASMDLSPRTAICPAVVGSCPMGWWLQLGQPVHRFFPQLKSVHSSSPKLCHTSPRPRN